MVTIKVRYDGTRHLTIHFPKVVDEVTVELPPSGDSEKPRIILTD